MVYSEWASGIDTELRRTSATHINGPVPLDVPSKVIYFKSDIKLHEMFLDGRHHGYGAGAMRHWEGPLKTRERADKVSPEKSIRVRLRIDVKYMTAGRREK